MQTDRKKKKTAVILGSGTNLMSQEELQSIKSSENCIVLGGNLTFIAHELDFFLSSYVFHCELSLRACPTAEIIKFSTIHDTPSYDNELVKIEYSDLVGICPDLVDKKNVCTEFNQLIGMTHFATTLQVDKIVYSGFHQHDYRYFWQADFDYAKRVEALVDSLITDFEANGRLLTSQDRIVIHNIIEHLSDVRDFTTYDFYNNSVIKAMFSDLEMLGITFECFDDNGIIRAVLDE